MMVQENPLYDEILAREVQVWNALACGDAQADAALLADDFIGVYADGVAVKADHVGQLQNGPTVATFAIQQARLIVLGQDHCLLTYRVDFQRAARAEVMYVTSIWALRGNDWVNIFSQDTMAVLA